MYKILIKAEPKCCKKPKNPVLGYYESNFDGWYFYKECGKIDFQTKDKKEAVEKYEQLLYTIPAKNLKLINELDTIIDFNLKPEPLHVNFSEELHGCHNHGHHRPNRPERPLEPTVCPDCGKNPCECTVIIEDEDAEFVCPDCGKNPCECTVIIEDEDAIVDEVKPSKKPSRPSHTHHEHNICFGGSDFAVTLPGECHGHHEHGFGFFPTEEPPIPVKPRPSKQPKRHQPLVVKILN